MSLQLDETDTETSEFFIDKFNTEFDVQVEKIADTANSIMSVGSFYDCGLFQIISFLFVSTAWTVGNGWYAYVSVFSGYTPSHSCDHARMGSHFAASPNDSKCLAVDTLTNQTVKCTHWSYDTSQMISTIVTEYNFVCDKDYYFELAYSVEQTGYVVGTLIFSYLADVIGRKPVMCMVLIGMSVCGLVQHFVTNFFVFMAMGLVINSLACGLEAVCVTLVLEMFSTSKRTFFGIGIEVVWVIVLASMSPLAYFIKKWREIRLVIFVVLSLLSVTSFWLCQESVRWLISMSKIDEAKQIIDRITKYNRLDKKQGEPAFMQKRKVLSIMLRELKSYNKEAKERENNNIAVVNNHRSNDRIIDIVKNHKFRMYILIMALNWFATALVYDGLTYLNNYIGENIFINWVSMNLIELPAQFMCYFVISRYGRRLTTSLTLILAGFILLASLVDTLEFVAVHCQWLKLAIFVLAKFIVTQSYSSVILHAPELFPTNLRSFGYGICLFSGKVTSMFSPMISIYLSKIYPRLPALIYGLMSMSCGLIALYVPETLNRPLPNSIDDVVHWSLSLSSEEKRQVRKLNSKEFRALFACCCCCRLKKKKRPGHRHNLKMATQKLTHHINQETMSELKSSKLLFSLRTKPENKVTV
jgi:MFS family permease